MYVIKRRDLSHACLKTLGGRAGMVRASRRESEADHVMSESTLGIREGFQTGEAKETAPKHVSGEWGRGGKQDAENKT